MKILQIIILTLLASKISAQVSESEKWRYVDMYTTLFSNSQLNVLDSSYVIQKSKCDKQIAKIIIDSIGKTEIKGKILNCSKDTLRIQQNSVTPTDYHTEVMIENVWYTFQIKLPLACGMTIGTAKLEPNKFCNFEISITTRGKYKLPFRIVIGTETGKLVSNEIEITCSKEQLKMIKKKIRPFTF